MAAAKARRAKPAPAPAPGISEKDVIEAYALLLGRDPESEAAIDDKIRIYPDAITLWRDIALCAEFREILGRTLSGRAAFAALMRANYWAVPRRVDYKVSPAVLERLVERVKQQWTVLGEYDPYWSVRTQPKFLRRNLDPDALAEFHASGAEAAGLIDLFVQRAHSKTPSGVCLELGCGVGRITRHLAERFDKVIAVDISAGNLAVCRQYLAESGVTNVETVHLNDLSELKALPRFDMFYSMIVLQHNSPPIQRLILRALLAKLNPGGMALFQMATDVENYSFDVNAYLASPSPVMEIHSIPKPAVFEMLREARLDLLDVAMDDQLGGFGSHTFFAEKPLSGLKGKKGG